MAETFEDVVKKLGSTVKKPSAGKASAVLAVQMVDKTGKVIKEEEGASAAEEQREEAARGKETITLLRTIAGAVSGAGAGAGADGPSKEDKKLGGMFAGVGRALGALGGGVGKGIGAFIKGIGSGASGAGQFVFVMGAFGAGIAAFALAIGAATWAISKMMPSIAKGLQEFKDVDGKNLISVGLGMGALGTGFAAMGAGGAIAGVGNLIGGIAEGVGSLFGIEGGKEALIEKLKKFSKLKLNVANIKSNAEAMVAYGVAMTAAGAGTAMKAIGTFTEGVFGGLGKMMGAVPPLEALKLFAKEDIDKVKVKNNAEAMAEYAKAMSLGAAAGGMKALGGIANLATGITDGLSKLIGGKGTLDTQLDALKKLSGAKGIDAAKIKLVTGAMVEYAKAMAVGAGAGGMKALGGIANLATGIFDGLSKLIGGEGVLDSQLNALKKLSGAKGIDTAKIKLVTGAMVEYAKAMAVGAVGKGAEAVGGLGNLVTGITDGLSKLVGGTGVLDSQLDALKKLSSAKGIDTAKIKLVTGAMVEYAKAMTVGAGAEVGKAVGGIGNLVTNISDGLSKLVGGTGVLDSQLAGLKKMTAASDGIDVKKIENVATAMVSYAKAMAVGAGGTTAKTFGAIANFVGGVVKSIGSFLGIKDADPIGDLKKFALKTITQKEVTAIELNAKGLQAYSTAMAAMSGTKIKKGFGEAIGGLLKGIGSLFSGGDKDPMTAIEKFAAKDINAERVKKNIEALQSFADFKYDRRSSSLKAFAKDLAETVPIIEAAIMGSEKFKLFGKNIKIKGLASTDIKYEKAVKNIRMLRKALGVETAAAVGTKGTVPGGGTKAAAGMDDAGLVPGGGTKAAAGMDDAGLVPGRGTKAAAGMDDAGLVPSGGTKTVRTSKKWQTIGGEKWAPGQALSKMQRGAIEMSLGMGNKISPALQEAMGAGKTLAGSGAAAMPKAAEAAKKKTAKGRYIDKILGKYKGTVRERYIDTRVEREKVNQQIKALGPMDKKTYIGGVGEGVDDQGMMMGAFSDHRKQREFRVLQKKRRGLKSDEKFIRRYGSTEAGARMSGRTAREIITKREAAAETKKITSAKPGGYLQKLIATATKHGFTAGDVVSASVYAKGDTPQIDLHGKGMELYTLHQGAALKASGKRTEQINKAGVERDTRGSDAGGGGTTSINTGGNVSSSPTTNYVNNGTAARRPIILQNVGSPF